MDETEHDADRQSRLRGKILLRFSACSALLTFIFFAALDSADWSHRPALIYYGVVSLIVTVLLALGWLLIMAVRIADKLAERRKNEEGK